MTTAFLFRRPLLLSKSAGTTIVARRTAAGFKSRSSSSGSSRVATTAAVTTIFSSPLVTAQEVKEALAKSPDSIRCVDASWHLGGDRNAKEEFKEGHLPGAVFFDIDRIADAGVPLPHMIPSEDVFSTKASELGLSSNDTIVVYAKKGSFSAPRCWWTFRAFGHERVHVLNGGFPAWESAGGSVERGEVNPVSTRPSSGLVQMSGNAWMLRSKGFQGRLNAPMLRTWRQVLSQSEKGKEAAGQVVDARSLARFKAEAPEPRAGVARGHVPGSACVPFAKVLVHGDVNRWQEFWAQNGTEQLLCATRLRATPTVSTSLSLLISYSQHQHAPSEAEKDKLISTAARGSKQMFVLVPHPLQHFNVGNRMREICMDPMAESC
ncbi:unnamed protein product [Ectocarpus sp. 4 AP-2014]